MKFLNVSLGSDFCSSHRKSQLYRNIHNSIPPEFVDKKQYLCSHCPEIYFNEGSLKNHIQKKHGKNSVKQYPKEFECKKCEITLFGRKEYYSHCENVHKGEEKIVKMRTDIKCNSCDEKFGAPSSYIKHHQAGASNLFQIRFEIMASEKLLECFVLNFASIQQIQYQVQW